MDEGESIAVVRIKLISKGMWFGEGGREPVSIQLLSGFRFAKHSEKPKKQAFSPWQNHKEAH